MQLPTGRALLAAHGLDPDDPQSFLLLDSGRTWTGTDAIRRVIAGLGGGWRCVHALVVVPPFAREWLYRLLARNRYRWFGRHDACLVPTTEQRGRFLDLG